MLISLPLDMCLKMALLDGTVILFIFEELYTILYIYILLPTSILLFLYFVKKNFIYGDFTSL